MQLEAQLLQDAAQESASCSWGKVLVEEPFPRCPTCQVPLQARGQQARTLQGNGGESVTMFRTYGTCPKCGERFPPLDEECAFLPRQPGTPATKTSRSVGKLDAISPCQPSCSKIFSACASAQKRPADSAKKSADGWRKSRPRKPTRPGRKKPTSERTLSHGQERGWGHGPFNGGRMGRGPHPGNWRGSGPPSRSWRNIAVGNLSYCSRLTDAALFYDC